MSESVSEEGSPSPTYSPSNSAATSPTYSPSSAPHSATFSPSYSPSSPRHSAANSPVYSPASPSIVRNYADQYPSPSYGCGSSKRRRRSEKAEDRISALPDALIIHILSFLRMKQVVRTGVLSKRWHLLWTSAHTLIFNYPGSRYHGITKFLTFVDDSLLLCKPSKVKKFSVDFVYDERCARHVNKWMIFIKNKYVEELDLYLRRGSDELYILPHHLYSNAWLQELSLCNCSIVPKGKINWPALRVLIIKYAKLNQDVVQKICSGCPALESLKFSSCSGVNLFNIDSKSVKKLVIDGYWQGNHDEEEEEELEIRARNITSLEIGGYFYKRIIVLEDIQALVDCKLDFYRKTYDYSSQDDSRTDKTMLRDLLVSLKHVEKLSIGSWCLQVLTILMVKNLSCPMMRCKSLTLNCNMTKWDLPGISILLQSCPAVEILNINLDSPLDEFNYGSSFIVSHDFDDEDYWISRPCWVLHLKTLKINRFWTHGNCHEDVFRFLQVVLKNAMALEKVIFDSYKGETRFQWPDYYIKAAEKLLSFPRSSRDAVILFSG